MSNHPEPDGGRIKIQEYEPSKRGLSELGACRGIVTHDGAKRFVSRAEARRLVELGAAMYCKDPHGNFVEE